MRTLLFLALSGLAFNAAAQSSIDNSATSGSESTAQTYGSVQNNIQTNSPDRIATTAAANIGGFAGSFSPDSCTSTAGGAVGATGFGISVGGPKADPNCQRMRVIERGGQLASQGVSLGYRDIAGKVYMVNVWNWCTSSPELTRACRQAGLVVDPAPER